MFSRIVFVLDEILLELILNVMYISLKYENACQKCYLASKVDFKECYFSIAMPHFIQCMVYCWQINWNSMEISVFCCRPNLSKMFSVNSCIWCVTAVLSCKNMCQNFLYLIHQKFNHEYEFPLKLNCEKIFCEIGLQFIADQFDAFSWISAPSH